MSLHHLAIATGLFGSGVFFANALSELREGREREAAWDGVLVFIGLLVAAILSGP